MRYASYKHVPPYTAPKGDLLVWQNTNRAIMYLPVQSVDDAKIVIHALAQRDLYLDAKSLLRVDFNMLGLIEFDGSEWIEWSDDDGMSVNEVMDAETED